MASCPAVMSEILVVPPSLRMFPIVVLSKRLMVFLVQYGDTGAQRVLLDALRGEGRNELGVGVELVHNAHVLDLGIVRPAHDLHLESKSP